MDTGAEYTIVHRISESDTTEATEHAPPHKGHSE